MIPTTTIGIDEVGRGSWAGPLLIVAVQASGSLPEGLTDSKLLGQGHRESFAKEIRRTCKIGEGWVSAAEIDAHGLSQAMRTGVKRALIQLRASGSDEIIMDGLVNYCPPLYTQVHCMPKADKIYSIVSAASIWAKVTRDAYMRQAALMFQNYGFEKHVGYGTALHLKALQTHGVCELHRLSFRPVKDINDQLFSRP